jgi:hypothetical protein
MIKKTLLLFALTVNVLGVAEGTFAAGTDFTATTDRRSEAEAFTTGTGGTTGKDLNGCIPGQFLPRTMTDFVKGVSSSVSPASGVAWDGFLPGTGALAPREMQDVAILTVRDAKGKEAWNGYAAGSLDYRQRNP